MAAAAEQPARRLINSFLFALLQCTASLRVPLEGVWLQGFYCKDFCYRFWPK